MINSIELTVDTIELESIVVSLNPPVVELQKRDLILVLNDVIFQDYTLFDKSGGIVYEIIPNTSFNPYDTLDMQIIRQENQSDKIKIFFAKAFLNDNAEIDFKLPETPQGEYVMKLMTVNSRSFNINSDFIVVSMPIDGQMSYANLDTSKVYFLEDNININIGLFTIEGGKVLDGKYEIKVELEK